MASNKFETILERLTGIEDRLIHLDGLPSVLNQISARLTTCETRSEKVEVRMNFLVDELMNIKQTCQDLQCRSMRYNLIFTNIIERENENSTTLVLNFMSDMMGIRDVKVDVAHRLGRWNADRTRPLIAKFFSI